MAGIIGAVGDNSYGGVGMNWKVRQIESAGHVLMPVPDALILLAQGGMLPRSLVVGYGL